MNDIGAEVGRMAGEAALIVKDRTGKAPDFSEQSVAVIEETLEEASRYFSDLPEDQARQLVQCFGCYLLEVARHQFGGSYRWRGGPCMASPRYGRPIRSRLKSGQSRSGPQREAAGTHRPKLTTGERRAEGG
jgi:hypothetical protein